MQKHPVLFVTQRGQRHQEAALGAAPPELEITMRRTTDKQEIIRLIGDAEFFISERSGEVDSEIIAAGKKLRLIQRLGSQTWDIDLEAAKRAGVPVCYWPVKTCVSVAEHMIMQMTGLSHRIREMIKITADAGDWGQTPQRCTEDYFAYNWSGRRNLGLIWRSTVGILGFGEIGVELARRLQGFECEVLYTKRKPLPPHAEADLKIKRASQGELIERSDYVCCLLPLFPETEMSINARVFARMKRGAYFIHCGAGAVVNEDDLIAALQSGHLAGAALDTYTYEPLRPNDPLLELARDPNMNLILTPHIAAGDWAGTPGERQDDYRNLQAVLTGGTLQYRLV